MIEIKPNTFIFEFKDSIKKEDCLNIIERFEKNKADHYQGKIGQSINQDLDIKKSTDLFLSGKEIWKDVDKLFFTALAKAALPYLNDNSSLLTLSYLGAERTMPNYNVMGLAKASLEANVRYLAYAMGEDNIRVNCISAGPIKTLAAAGITDFRKMLDHVEKNSPLRRNVTIQEVGDTASFLASDGASGITGQTLYVDSGYNIIGMPALD